MKKLLTIFLSLIIVGAFSIASAESDLIETNFYLNDIQFDYSVDDLLFGTNIHGESDSNMVSTDVDEELTETNWYLTEIQFDKDVDDLLFGIDNIGDVMIADTMTVGPVCEDVGSETNWYLSGIQFDNGVDDLDFGKDLEVLADRAELISRTC